MWMMLFSISFAAAIGLSMAALALQNRDNDRIGCDEGA
jgi:hypothetical protein